MEGVCLSMFSGEKCGGGGKIDISQRFQGSRYVMSRALVGATVSVQTVVRW